MVRKNENSISFEDGLKELEGIVNKLENGNLTLEESLKEFQRGVELYRKCYSMINEVENKVKILLNSEDGELKEIDFLKEY